MTNELRLCHAGFAWVAEVPVPVIARQTIYFAAFRLGVEKGVARTFSVLARLDLAQRARLAFGAAFRRPDCTVRRTGFDDEPARGTVWLRLRREVRNGARARESGIVLLRDAVCVQVLIVRRRNGALRGRFVFERTARSNLRQVHAIQPHDLLRMPRLKADFVATARHQSRLALVCFETVQRWTVAADRLLVPVIAVLRRAVLHQIQSPVVAAGNAGRAVRPAREQTHVEKLVVGVAAR